MVAAFTYDYFMRQLQLHLDVCPSARKASRRFGSLLRLHSRVLRVQREMIASAVCLNISVLSDALAIELET